MMKNGEVLHRPPHSGNVVSGVSPDFLCAPYNLPVPPGGPNKATPKWVPVVSKAPCIEFAQVPFLLLHHKSPALVRGHTLLLSFAIPFFVPFLLSPRTLLPFSLTQIYQHLQVSIHHELSTVILILQLGVPSTEWVLNDYVTQTLLSSSSSGS